MAQTVKLISDSTCDLSKELVEKYDITILPLHILLGEDEYCDGVDITPEEIFRWSDENKTTPKTSAPSLTEAMEVMQPFVEEGREIICFSISDSMSTSSNVMRLAAEELEASDKVTVINSANLSTGIGLQVIQAAILASEGKTAAEITTAIEAIRPKVRASFVVDTLHIGIRLQSARLPESFYIRLSGIHVCTPFQNDRCIAVLCQIISAKKSSRTHSDDHSGMLLLR